MSIADKLTTIAENESKVFDKGVADGIQTEYDRFWNAYQNNGEGMSYGSYAFAYDFWNDKTFYPKYDITPYASAIDYFFACKVSNLRERIDGRGLKLDLRRTTTLIQWFRESVTCELPDFDSAHIKQFNRFLYSAKKLHTVHRLNMTSATSASDAFYRCDALQNITFEGVIPISLSFADCVLLTHESLMSIIDALKDLTGTGTTHTLTLGTTNLEKLTDAEKAIATQKGWTIT